MIWYGWLLWFLTAVNANGNHNRKSTTIHAATKTVDANNETIAIAKPLSVGRGNETTTALPLLSVENVTTAVTNYWGYTRNFTLEEMVLEAAEAIKDDPPMSFEEEEFDEIIEQMEQNQKNITNLMLTVPPDGPQKEDDTWKAMRKPFNLRQMMNNKKRTGKKPLNFGYVGKDIQKKRKLRRKKI